MKKRATIIFFSVILGLIANIYSQNFDNAFEYLSYIQERDQKITNQLWTYISTKAHTKRQKKIDKSKDNLLETIISTKNDILKMPSFNGDVSLRDSMVNYFIIYENIISGDYVEIEALQFASQKSYSAMKKYLEKFDAVNKKMSIQRKNVTDIYNKFATKNNINLVNSNSKLSAKMQLTNIINEYYNSFYLLYFRNFVAQTFIIQSINNADTLAFDAWTDSLNTAISSGTVILSTLNAYNNDFSLKNSCSKSLQTAKLISNLYIQPIRNYFSEKAKFEQLKNIVDNTSESELTQDMINKYNNSVNSFNAAVENYNKSITKFNKLKQDDFEQWNKASSIFLDKNIPK